MRQVDVVLDFMSAYSTGDVETLKLLLHPDVDWSPPLSALEGHAYHGPDEVAGWYANVREMFERVTLTPLEVRACEDGSVVGTYRWCGRTHGGGVEIEELMLGRAQLDDELIRRFDGVTNPTPEQYAALGFDAGKPVPVPHRG